MTTTLSWWRTDRSVPVPAAAAPGAVLGFHRRLPGYTPTPLVALPGLASERASRRYW